jgi:hypothetical protein
MRALEAVGYNYATGAFILGLAALSIGMLAAAHRRPAAPPSGELAGAGTVPDDEPDAAGRADQRAMATSERR